MFKIFKGKNQPAFLKKLNSIDMWGGSGAVWKIGGFKTKEDDKEFCRLIISLTELMKEIGIKKRRAYAIAALFRSELAE